MLKSLKLFVAHLFHREGLRGRMGELATLLEELVHHLYHVTM